MSLVTDRPRTRPEPAARGGGAPLLRAVGACVSLLSILVGVPALLVVLGAALPIQLGVLAPASWASPDTGGLLLVVLLAVAWLAWGAVAASVAVETWAALRRVPTPRLPGLAAPQRLAAGLVASLIVVLAPGTGWTATAAAADEAPAQPAALAELVAGLAAPTASEDSSTRARGASAPSEQESFSDRSVTAPTVEVQRHDTLWQLAEAHLGSGERFTEIIALNLGVPQADGRALRSDGRLYPGWVLTLPADADVSTPRADDQHVVEPGETLWEIAEERLGEGSRYPEVFAENRGVPQPDGDRLRDPDLIRPGWVLDLPGDDGATAHVPDSEESTAGGGQPDEDSQAAAAEGAAEQAGSPVGGLPTLDRVPDEAPTSAPSPDVDLDATSSQQAAPSASPRASTPSLDRAATDEERSSATVLPAGGALTALLLAGIAGELARRRRQFQRHRRPGERMPTPTPEQRDLEAVTRGAVADGADDSADLLDRALHQLGRTARRQGAEVPTVRVVRCAPGRVQLDLADPVEGPGLSPFTAVDASTWVLDPAFLVELEGDSAAERPDGSDDADWTRPYPGLVTLGMQGADTVLVDVAALGTLRLDGSEPDVADVLRGLSAELAFGPARDTAARTLCLDEPLVAQAVEPGELTIAGAEEGATLLAAAVARLDGPDAVELVLADQSLPRGDGPLVVPPSAGAGLITTDPAVGSGPTLRIDGHDAAVLLPEGIVLVPQALTVESAQDLVGLFAATTVPDEPLLEDAEGTLDIDAHQGADVAAAAQPGGPRLLLLGELRVEGAAGPVESTRIGRLAETIAFVHVNPGSRPSALQSALWPGVRANPQTCRQMITRTRTWLGRTSAGEPYLMQLADTSGTLRVRPEVTSDWDDFQRLAAAGLADPTDTTQLAAALRLVRGRPFGPVAARELPWADLIVNEMIELIVDVAHELAVRHERAGNASAARDAALRGLRTECESEALQAIVARLGRTV